MNNLSVTLIQGNDALNCLLLFSVDHILETLDTTLQVLS